jgi:hypothetical protein
MGIPSFCILWVRLSVRSLMLLMQYKFVLQYSSHSGTIISLHVMEKR